MRDELISELKHRDIYLNISYPWPIHLMRGYSYLGGKEGDLPVTEELAKTVFSLPMYPTLKEEMQTRVCQVIADILGESTNLSLT
jgi:aminotransferase EvaB